MKRYSVYVKFLNGEDIQFMTDINVFDIMPIHINGDPLIIIDAQHSINLVEIERLELVEIGRGKIREFVSG